MVSCQAFQGCPVCLHSWSPGGPLRQTKCVCDGYRRFMPAGHAIRATTYRHGGNLYRYRSCYFVSCDDFMSIRFSHASVKFFSSTREDRLRPKLRTNALVRTATDYAKHIRTPFLGHKFVPQPQTVLILIHDTDVFLGSHK